MIQCSHWNQGHSQRCGMTESWLHYAWKTPCYREIPQNPRYLQEDMANRDTNCRQHWDCQTRCNIHCSSHHHQKPDHKMDNNTEPKCTHRKGCWLVSMIRQNLHDMDRPSSLRNGKSRSFWNFGKSLKNLSSWNFGKNPKNQNLPRNRRSQKILNL